MNRPSLALLACCLAFFWAQSSRAVLYSAMPALSAETGLVPATIGLITGTLYAGYAVAVFVSGLLPLSRRAAIAGGFVVSAIGNVAFASTSSVPLMLVIAALGGAGAGLYLPRGTAVIIESFSPAARARAMGWHEVAASAGLMGGPVFLGTMLLVVSWRVAVMTFSLVGVATAVVVWWWIPEPPARSSAGPAERVRVDARVPALACIGAASFVVMSGFFTMLPTIVARGWGVSPAASASFTGWTRASGLAGALAGGWAADLAGRTRSIAAWHALALTALVTLWFLDYGLAFGLAIAVMTIAACAAATAYYALLGDAYRSGDRERIFGYIAATASLVGSTLTPVVLGLVLDRSSARATLVALTAGPLMGLGGLVFYRAVMRRRP